MSSFPAGAPIRTITQPTPDQTDALTAALEGGELLFLPDSEFSLLPAEQQLLRPDLVDPKRKNISFRIDSGRLTGVASPNDAPVVTALLQRYHRHVMDWLQRLLPHYSGHLSEPVNTLRVHAVDAWQQASSWRQDDRRLHVDAFPSRPVHGQRILRFLPIFTPRASPAAGEWASPSPTWPSGCCPGRGATRPPGAGSSTPCASPRAGAATTTI